MPILFQQDINPFCVIGVWRIDEKDDYFLRKVAPAYPINHPLKRSQHLAGRYLLQELMPEISLMRITINNSGKPKVEGSECSFSISHSKEYAAVIVSEKGLVGIDVEYIDNKALALQHKFISEEERKLLGLMFPDERKMATAGWCVKESVFKWYGEGKVDFLQHIRLISVERHEELVHIKCMFRKQEELILDVRLMEFENMLLAYLIDV